MVFFCSPPFPRDFAKRIANETRLNYRGQTKKFTASSPHRPRSTPAHTRIILTPIIAALVARDDDGNFLFIFLGRCFFFIHIYTRLYFRIMSRTLCGMCVTKRLCIRIIIDRGRFFFFLNRNRRVRAGIFLSDVLFFSPVT